MLESLRCAVWATLFILGPLGTSEAAAANANEVARTCLVSLDKPLPTVANLEGCAPLFSDRCSKGLAGAHGFHDSKLLSSLHSLCASRVLCDERRAHFPRFCSGDDEQDAAVLRREIIFSWIADLPKELEPGLQRDLSKRFWLVDFSRVAEVPSRTSGQPSDGPETKAVSSGIGVGRPLVIGVGGGSGLSGTGRLGLAQPEANLPMRGREISFSSSSAGKLTMTLKGSAGVADQVWDALSLSAAAATECVQNIPPAEWKSKPRALSFEIELNGQAKLSKHLAGHTGRCVVDALTRTLFTDVVPKPVKVTGTVRLEPPRH